jgi:hypothetical protein
MNIFYLDHCPKLCAMYHLDKHVIKMILEYCQLLSTVHRIVDGEEIITQSKSGRNVKRWVLNNNLNDIIYSATHINHPSTIWTRESSLHYDWLYNLLIELCNEYTYRYGKVHKCQNIGLVDILQIKPQNILYKDFVQPTPAMPDECKVNGDSLQSYRNYYIMKKQHITTWNGKINSRSIPEWFQINL